MFSASTKRRALCLYATGLTAAAVGKILHMSPTTVGLWVTQAGLNRRAAAKDPRRPDLAYTGGWIHDGRVWRGKKDSEAS